MLKYFVWVVRDLLQSGVLIALFFALAALCDKKLYKKSIFISSLTGFALSLIYAFIKYNNLIRDRYLIIVNLYLLGFVLFTSLLYLVFNFSFLKKLCGKVQEYVLSICGAVIIGGTEILVLPVNLLHPFHFLIKGQSVFSTDYLFKLIGFLFGLSLIALIILCAYKIFSHLNYVIVHRYASFFIFFNAISQVGNFLGPMIVRRWIRVSKPVQKFSQFTRNNGILFAFIFVLIVFSISLLLYWKSLHNTEEYSNPAEHRKIRIKCIHQRRWASAFIFLGLLSVFDLTYLKSVSERTVTLSPAEPFHLNGDIITIPLEQVQDGLLHRFEYVTSDEVGIRFIVIQKNAFAFGIGFDACEICGDTGYYQKNGQVICKLCDVVMNINTIGYKGGCNPIPLPYDVKDGAIVINANDLLVEKRRFR